MKDASLSLEVEIDKIHSRRVKMSSREALRRLMRQDLKSKKIVIRKEFISKIRSAKNSNAKKKLRKQMRKALKKKNLISKSEKKTMKKLSKK